MIKIIIFSDSYKHFESAIKEYEKRLSTEVQIITLKPSKRKNISEIIDEETLILKDRLQKEKGYKILLYIDGKIFSTQSFLDLVG